MRAAVFDRELEAQEASQARSEIDEGNSAPHRRR